MAATATVLLAVSLALSAAGPGGQYNFLPNSQWQVATAIGSSPLRNATGTGLARPIRINSCSTGQNTVTCLTGDTGELEVGELIRFQPPCEEALRQSAVRVDAIVPGRSLSVALPLGATLATSAACEAIPWNIGGASSAGTGDAFDGWEKFPPSVQVWREGRAANIKAGSRYALGLLKSEAASQYLYHSVPKRDLDKYRGRQVVFGVWVKGGSWRPFAHIGYRIYGSAGSPASTADAVGSGWQWRELSVRVPDAAPLLQFGIELRGAAGRAYYVSQPIADLGSALGEGSYRAPLNELLIPRVKLSMATYTGATLHFSAAPSQASSPKAIDAQGRRGDDFGFWLRLYAETNGAIAPTVKQVLMQLEARCDLAGVSLGIRNREGVRGLLPVIYGLLRYSKVPGAMECAEGTVTLNDGADGAGMGDLWIYTGTPGGPSWYGASLDLNGFVL